MTRPLLIVLGLLWTADCGLRICRAEAPAASQGVRFVYVDVFVDSGDKGLGAYQFELSADKDRVKIAGVEGGEHAAFAEPPYYDPAALQNSRIIIAAFSTSKDLPAGKTRVARIMLQVSGDGRPECKVNLDTAGGADGQAIAAKASVVEGEAK